MTVRDTLNYGIHTDNTTIKIFRQPYMTSGNWFNDQILARLNDTVEGFEYDDQTDVLRIYIK